MTLLKVSLDFNLGAREPLKTFKPDDILVDITIFALATLGTYLAQSVDRPITAVLIYLSGVILIAAHSGLLHALCAALLASLTFNFFLNEPAFRFGITTADEAVPLIAFNLSAIVAGAMVGRLRDSTNLARSAQNETAFLLTVSDRLQRAIKIEDIESEVRSMLPTQRVEKVEIYLAQEDHYIRPATGVMRINRLEPLLNNDADHGGPKDMVIVELLGSKAPLGIVKFCLTEDFSDRSGIPDLRSMSPLLAVAVERCILLKQISEVQASKRSEEIKDAIISSVSHDLRTPLTAIETAASALSSSEVTLQAEEQATLLKSILTQCGRLNRYTSDLLDMGKIQAGISRTHFETIELADVLNLAVNRANSGLIATTNIHRNFTRNALYVSANATMLEQAFFNIIENATKYGYGPGHKTSQISVSLSAEADHGLVMVTDSGPGINKIDQANVFSRFFKSEAGKGQDGSGLGLFIAKGFVEAFAGEIAIASPLSSQGGTRMEVRLPLVPHHSDLETA